MKKFLFLLLIAAAACSKSPESGNELTPQQRLAANDDSINAIISQMTLDEKVAMLHAKTIMSSAGAPRFGIADFKYCDGPFSIRCEVGEHFQTMPHPTDSATYFPTGSALAATWSPELAYRYGHGMGTEARLRGKDMVLGPAVNIQRLPVGGRTYEYLSEDPLLAAELAEAYTVGCQDAGTAVCVKHFAVNSQETDRGTINSVIDERSLREIYLKPFEAAVVNGGAMGVMSAYNKVNGGYCSENVHLNNDILRGEWGFNGMVISDWGGTHSTVGCALGGLTVQMPGDEFFGQALIDSVRSGAVPESVVDDKVREILRVRFAVYPVPDDVANTVMTSQPASQQTALDVARKSIVLLKNDGHILPAAKDAKKIAVLGANAKLSTATGGIGADAYTLYEITPLQGIQEAAQGEVVFAPAYPTYMSFMGNFQKLPAGLQKATAIDQAPDEALMAEAIEAAKDADVVFFFAGTNKFIESEGFDRANIDLPVSQNEIVKRIAEVNPNIVTVVVSGGPTDLREIADNSKAVVQSWWNGMEAGHALADVLFGEVSPSGKLPFTFPLKLEDSPAYATGSFPQTAEAGADVFLNTIAAGNKGAMAESKNAEYAEGMLVGYRWYDSLDVPVLYPFGYGLSYAEFEYSDLKAKRTKEAIEVKVDVKNIGKMEADEVVQAYVSRDNTQVEWPKRELKAFQRVTLDPGQKKTVTLSIPLSSLRYYDVDKKAWADDNADISVQVADLDVAVK